jgi:uncharacterized protein (TIGR02147 family)
MSAPVSVFDFFNYRRYLEAYFRYRKGFNPRFSHRYFARKAGYNSSGLYLLLVSGKQNLTPSYLPKFVKGLELGPLETDYFRMMVAFTHAETAAAKQEILERMVEQLPPGAKDLRREQAEYYRSWHNVAVREALSVLDIRDNLGDLAAFIYPPLGVRQVRASLRLLASLGLIKRNAKGIWRATHAVLASTPEVGPLHVHKFQKTMMDLAKDALDRYPRESRNISCSTFSVSAQGLERLNLKVTRFLRDIEDLVRSDEKEDQVYQFNVQLFPLSRRKA